MQMQVEMIGDIVHKNQLVRKHVDKIWVCSSSLVLHIGAGSAVITAFLEKKFLTQTLLTAPSSVTTKTHDSGRQEIKLIYQCFWAVMNSHIHVIIVICRTCVPSPSYSSIIPGSNLGSTSATTVTSLSTPTQGRMH